MNKKIWLYGALALVVLFIFNGVNAIPRMEEKVNASWAEVQNQYQRRMDLIPNIVASVKGYAAHEKTALTDVIQARANATKMNINAESISDPEALKRFEEAQGRLGSALARLMVVSENYPNLKADQQFYALQTQLEGTENRIAIARRDYIAVVQEYNTAVRTFPTRIWAAIYGAKPKANFGAQEGADKAPKVEF